MKLHTSNFNSLLATNLIFGEDCVNENLPLIMKEQGYSKIFIATDPGIVSSGILNKVIVILEGNNITYEIFSDVETNPLDSTVMEGMGVYVKGNCELIIALGGGSAMDFAKGVSAVVGNGGHILDYRRGKETLHKKCPTIIAIPTTVGTGSEVTPVSVITDPKAKRKYIIASPYIQPRYAMVDPTLTYTLPAHIVASTGMDALVHAIESYTSNAANPFSESFSMQAMKMLVNNLPSSFRNIEDREARAQVHLASTLAGFAFNYGKLGIVHSCSHPMSARYGVPHGVANAVILPYVLEFNKVTNIEKFAEIARLFDATLIGTDDKEAASQVSNVVHRFNVELSIPSTFKHLNIDFTQQMIEELAKDAMDDVGTFPFNPRQANMDDIVSIYQKVLT